MDEEDQDYKSCNKRQIDANNNVRSQYEQSVVNVLRIEVILSGGDSLDLRSRCGHVKNLDGNHLMIGSYF